jgi:hypothetical protein
LPFRYACNLWRRPGCFVVLHRPFLVAEEGSTSATTTFITDTTRSPQPATRPKLFVTPSNPSNGQLLADGLAVLSSPRYASRIEATVMAIWIVAAVLSCLAFSSPGATLIPAHTSAAISFLLYLPSLPLLPALDVSLLPRLLLQQFETTLVLLGNILLALFCCATGVFGTAATTIISVSIVLSSLPILVFDGLHLSARIKLRRAAAYSILYIVIMVWHGLVPLHTLDEAKVGPETRCGGDEEEDGSVASRQWRMTACVPLQ